MSPDSFAASVCASIFCLYSAVNLRRLARAITSGFGRGAARPPVMSPNTESNIPVACIAGRAEPFIVAMLSLFPALLTNCGYTRCLSHVGTEGNAYSVNALLADFHSVATINDPAETP